MKDKCSPTSYVLTINLINETAKYFLSNELIERLENEAIETKTTITCLMEIYYKVENWYSINTL